MRRYLVSTPIGGADAPLEYKDIYIIDAIDDDDAVLIYNKLFESRSQYGVVIGFIREDMTTKYVRSGSVDTKTMLRMYNNGNLIPYNDRKVDKVASD